MKPLDRLLQSWRIAKAEPFIPSDASLLDVGCGNGALLRRVSSRIRSGVGIDSQLTQPSNTNNLRVYPGRFPQDLPEPGPFDLITMLAVLEHVPADEQSIWAQTCARLLKPRGRLVITVPSPRVDSILKILRTLRLLEGIALDQHYGFDAAKTEPLFTAVGFHLILHRRFQLGLNHLFVFRKIE